MNIQRGVRRAKCGVKSFQFWILGAAVKTRTPHSFDKLMMVSNVEPSALRTSRGFTYIALLTAIVIMGILSASAGKYWQNVLTREKEEELLFRGSQYRLAIARYYHARMPNMLPPTIDELLSDGRFPTGMRHLRQQYKDPFTGEDFELLRDLSKGNRINGVYSPSDKEPLKQRGFPEEYKEFDGKKSYRDWKFQFTPLRQVPLPGQPQPRSQPPPPG